MLKGAAELLVETLNTALPAIDAAAASAMQNNLSLTDIIAITETPAWPSGKVNVIYANLVQKFSPEDDTTDVAKDDALDDIPSLEKSENPQVLFDAIAK